MVNLSRKFKHAAKKIPQGFNHPGGIQQEGKSCLVNHLFNSQSVPYFVRDMETWGPGDLDKEK